MLASGPLELIPGSLDDLSLEIENDARLLGCIQCGRCSGICPLGSLMEYPPSRVIAAVRSGSYHKVKESDTIWLCIACQACSAVCPVQIPLTNIIMSRIKEEFLLSGNVPAELQSALENSQRYGNPMGESPRKRVDWTRSSETHIPVMGKDTRSADVLWFVGDYASYHPRVHPSSLAFARILNSLGVNFAILGSDENSDGDSQRLAGERGLFELLMEKNARTLSKYKFKEIVTTDPHAYNAFKREYPTQGVKFPVRHSTQLLAELIDMIRPMLTREIRARVTFHDPCYLGRVNGIYDEPRALLKAIPGITLVEMPHTRSTSLCCGGGGGGMWMDGFLWEKARVRLSEWRVREAAMVNADILAISCPYEISRFDDATKTVKGGEGIVVRDICELIVESMNHYQE